MYNTAPDPISGMGRAVQAKTQGMTPQEVAALDQQYAKMGLMSINDVITLKQQLDQMKQNGQGGQPPATTVVQDMQQQMGGNGIAGLPANVGNERAYAKGGIVAFADAGLVGGASQVPGFGQYVDDAVKAAPDLKNVFQNAEAAAARVPPQARKAVLSRLLSGVKWMPKHPYLMAAAVGLPIVYSFLSGGDDEEEAPVQTVETEPPVDLSGIMAQAREEGMGGGIASLIKGGGGMPDVNAGFAPHIQQAQTDLAAATPRSYEDIQKEIAPRYAGLTDHITAREAALKEQEQRMEDSSKGKFGKALATFGFGMAKAAGESGATWGGAAATGALEGMKEYERLTDKYEEEKTKLADSMFGMGEAKAANQRAIMGDTTAEQGYERGVYESRLNRLHDLEARRTEALITAQSQMLDRQASMAIAAARDKGLTGMDLLEHAAAIAGSKFGENSPAFKQLTGLLSAIGENSLSSVLGKRFAEQDGLMGPQVGGTGRVIGARPVGQ